MKGRTGSGPYPATPSAASLISSIPGSKDGNRPVDAVMMRNDDPKGLEM